jgi:hypothetical protein
MARPTCRCKQSMIWFFRASKTGRIRVAYTTLNASNRHMIAYYTYTHSRRSGMAIATVGISCCMLIDCAREGSGIQVTF